MNDFLRLVKKELRELLRPRYLIPLLITPLFLVVVMQGVGVQEQTTQDPAIAVLNNDNGTYGQLAVRTLEGNATVTHESTDVSSERAIETVRSGPAQTLFVVPSDFTERIRSGDQAQIAVYTTTDQINFASASRSATTSALLEVINERLALAVTDASPVSLDPTTSSHTTYVRGTQLAGSPGELSSVISSRFFFLSMVMVFAIFGSGQLMIQGMGSEKEAKTLETLLTLPIKRRTIVAAKLTSSAVLGLLLAGLYIGAIYMARPTRASDSVAVPQLGGGEYVLIGVVLTLAIVDILALALWLGVFADDSKGAQTLLAPLMVVTMSPAFVSAFVDVGSLPLVLKAGLFAIPATYPIIAPQRLLFGDGTIILIGIVYQLVFAVVLTGLVVRLFDSDRLVTGESGRLGTLIDLFQR